MIKTGLGQDSHALSTDNKPLILAGVVFEHSQGLRANSDGDVVYHSITNAISSITGVNILGTQANTLCQQGITNSDAYLKLALKDLQNWHINHIAIAIECLTPKIVNNIKTMKTNIATICNITTDDVGITATTGEGLNAFGKGKGIQVFSIITVSSI